MNDFPINNLPLGVARRNGHAHIVTTLDDQLFDLHAVAERIAEPALREPVLNALMAKGREASRNVRERARELLERGSADEHLFPRDGAELLLPVRIGDYTDFYASIHHATNVGSMFRPDNPLLPNYKWLPVGYHGRASSIVVSGTPVQRPLGQTSDNPAAPPSFGPSRRLDYEMEVGALIGRGNALGTAVSVDEAPEHVFGFCLVNDWSARDIQTWEYQPLGPFLAKNFATTISPWIVTADALEPFRVAPPARTDGDPQPLPHLASPDNFTYDITVEVWLRTAKMQEPLLVSRGRFRDLYWTPSQMIAHHTSNGCNLQPGDLLASGTVSGPDKESRGCLLERTWRGTEPLELPTGETRKFLEDGDEVVMRGYCDNGTVRIGFGECRGTVVGG